MSTLVAIRYDEPRMAHKVRLSLLKLQREGRIESDVTLTAVKNQGGKIRQSLSEAGIDNRFVNRLTENLWHNASALFVLVRESTADEIIDHVKVYGGIVLQTSLAHEEETKLQATLENAQQEPSKAFVCSLFMG
jgi:uncharacterized membrane protein